MNAWHLLWIVPLASCIGFIFAAILAAGSAAEDAAEKKGADLKDAPAIDTVSVVKRFDCASAHGKNHRLFCANPDSPAYGRRVWFEFYCGCGKRRMKGG